MPIVISTIQKFPFITQAMETLAKKGEAVAIETAGKRFAVIVDEAHSSQSGETAMELRKILNKEGIEAAIADQILDGEDEEELSEEAQKELMAEMLKRPRQPNLSFFAFTATPKVQDQGGLRRAGAGRVATLSPLQHAPGDRGEIHPRRLANYTTYKTYYGLIKEVEDDPNVPKRKAAKALARFLSLHPHNIAQKVEVIVEHFRSFTRHRIGGQAKAMVVTSSRLHAVRYKLAFDKYVREKGYNDIAALVAFSGSVVDPDLPGQRFTEVGMNNGLKETELPEQFAGEDYQILDRCGEISDRLRPATLTHHVRRQAARRDPSGADDSRLNRTVSGKEDTFVLDFVNDREEIYRAFKPYYGDTPISDEPDPHRLYELQHEVEEFRLFDASEVNAFCEVWFRGRVSNPPPAITRKSTRSSAMPYTALSVSTTTRARKRSGASLPASNACTPSLPRSFHIRIRAWRSSTPTVACYSRHCRTIGTTTRTASRTTSICSIIGCKRSARARLTWARVRPVRSRGRLRSVPVERKRPRSCFRSSSSS